VGKEARKKKIQKGKIRVGLQNLQYYNQARGEKSKLGWVREQETREKGTP